MDTRPYGCFISTRGESVETVGKNPVRTDGSVAPNAFANVRTYERTGPTLPPSPPSTPPPPPPPRRSLPQPLKRTNNGPRETNVHLERNPDAFGSRQNPVWANPALLSSSSQSEEEAPSLPAWEAQALEGRGEGLLRRRPAAAPAAPPRSELWSIARTSAP